MSVAGDFNGWSADATPLSSEDNGYWSTDVAGAHDGQQYKYVVRTSDGLRRRNDPYAREVTSSVGNSVVRADNFDWVSRSSVCRRGTSS